MVLERINNRGSLRFPQQRQPGICDNPRQLMKNEPLTAQQIIQGYSAKTDLDTLAEKNREHLRQALTAKCYTTERDSIFFRRYAPGTLGNALTGEKLMVPQGTNTRPIRSYANSLLVRYADSANNHWFAWIHA